MTTEDQRTSVAQVKITINGTNLSSEAYEELNDVVVHDDVDVPSMFSCRFLVRRNQSIEESWADDDKLSIGAEVEIALGYNDELTVVMIGEITGLELELEGDTIPAVVVRGYDRRHRLLRGHKTRSFVKMKDSDIASKIASDQGLSAKATDTNVIHPYVLQHSLSDLEFLVQRADSIGYEVVVEDATLHFRPRRASTAQPIQLAMDRDLLEFFPKMTARHQVGQVEVRGWDPLEKKAILGKAKAGQDALAGDDAGPKLSDKAFGDSVSSYVRHPVATQEEANDYAMKHLLEVGAVFITAEGMALGRSDIRAGSVLEIQKVGKRFGGRYHVLSAMHMYSPKGGYRTKFGAKKEAT